jgi:hypothetical protein
MHDLQERHEHAVDEMFVRLCAKYQDYRFD